MVTGSLNEDQNLDLYNDPPGYGERYSAATYTESGFSDSCVNSPRMTEEQYPEGKQLGLEPGCSEALLSEQINDPICTRSRGRIVRAQKSALNTVVTPPEAPPQDDKRRKAPEEFKSGPPKLSAAAFARKSVEDVPARNFGSGSPRPAMRRRGSCPHINSGVPSQAADDDVPMAPSASSKERPRRLSNAGLLGSADPAEAFRQMASPSPVPSADREKIGFEWMARLQACEDSKQRIKDSSRQILLHTDAAGLDITKLQSFEKFSLQNKIGQEIDTVVSYLLKQAFDNVSADEEELANLRKLMNETEERISNMNRTYLKEITTVRDRNRVPDPIFNEAVGNIDEGHVEFYEPLQYLSEDMRSTFLTILDEKIKAIFAYDPKLKDRSNALELAKFEDHLRDDRLRSFTKMNSNLRDENRELRSKLQKTSANLEKHEWELHQANKKVAELEAALEAEKQRPETCDAEVQSEEVEQVEQVKPPQPASPSCSPSRSPRLMVSKYNGGVKPAMPKPQLDKYDVGVQADFGERRPSLVKRKSSFDRFMETDNLLSRNNSGHVDNTDMGVQLNKARRELDLAKKTLQSRDVKIQRLETDLKMAQDKADRLETELRTLQDLQALQEATPVSPSASTSKAEVESGAQRIQTLEDALEKAENETQVARHQARTLRADLEAARQATAKAEKRRLESVKGCVSEEICDELDEAMKSKNALFEELEQTKAAFSLVLSRNAALEMAVAAFNEEGQKDAHEAKPRAVASREAAKENDQLCNLMSQRGELREKVSVQKAQLQSIMQENTTLHLALQEMQQEVQHLTKQLRNAVPDIEVMSADLEAVLGRMDRVVRDGGGGYMRLHKEAQLRNIASETKAARRAEDATAEATSVSEACARRAKDARVEATSVSEAQRQDSSSPSNFRTASPTNHRVSPREARRASGGGTVVRSAKVEPLAPVSPPPGNNCQHVPPRRASGTKTWSEHAASGATSWSANAWQSSNAPSHWQSSRVPVKEPAHSLKESEHSHRQVQRTRSNGVAANTEQRGSLAIGGRGGMAVLGHKS